MDTNSHLQRMAGELKCPICLCLLKSAVSLTCNHIFCNVCIEKSMKSDSTCPVCKVPYRRREIRPAPHMDTLVSIYKGMEASSGVNIIGTQTQPHTTDNENCVEDATVGKSKKASNDCNGIHNTQNQRKNKQKALKGSSKKTKRCNSDIERPSFPTKKRIQVPLHHPQETPTRPTNVEGGKCEVNKDRIHTNVSGREGKGRAKLNENDETLFTPFFWLRNEEDVEKTTQLTPLDPVNDSPQDAPCFSDIKDSEENHDCHEWSWLQDINMFDSEMFEWTQRPCSPELCASPMKNQDKEFHEIDIVQDNNKNGEKVPAQFEVVLPTLSSHQVQKVDHEAKVKGPKKRAKKTKECISKKKAKKDTDNVVSNSTTSLKADHDKRNNTGELVKSKKQNRGSGKKASKSKVSTSLTGEGSGNIQNANSDHRTKRETATHQLTKKTKKLKNQDPTNSNISVTEISKNCVSHQLSEPPVVDGEIKTDAFRRQTKKGYFSKDLHLQTSKKVTFCLNKSSEVTSVDNVVPIYGNVSTKTNQSLGESDPTRKLNATFLRKCDVLSNICCAFCQSTRESDISGCMAHYLKGKPLTLDHEDVPLAIHAHTNCTEWAPNVYFEDDIAVNLEAELARSKRITCSCCGLKGAALGCYEKSCRKSFHFTCAKLTPQCRWDNDNFVMLCPLHSSHKLPNETSGSQPKEKKKYVPKRQINVKHPQVPIGDAVVTASRWDSYGLFTKIVLCCSALTSIEKEIVVKFEKLSGVTVLKTWDPRVTHVVASVDENGACRRTLKYLMGILNGKWILNIEWIKACMEVKKPVDEQPYEINLDIHGFKGGPKLGRFMLLNKEPKLFNGFKFYFTGDFVASYKGYLHDLIIAGGGTVLHRKPVPVNNEKQFLIYSLELTDKLKANEQNRILSQRKSAAEALAKSTGAVAVSNSWILNSIAASKLQNIE
ncbi:protein BREAST CANCER SUSCEPTIBILITY 1 homolog [Rutidosis leptorrhynchoides]|uniref:protein BREAST CANCER SUSCEPTIBILITY 1 homolog n=1 Tax=Rutidosis leptorrhynchoides TaxID=125765 RepID=UPI003A99301C